MACPLFQVQINTKATPMKKLLIAAMLLALISCEKEEQVTPIQPNEKAQLENTGRLVLEGTPDDFVSVQRTVRADTTAVAARQCYGIFLEYSVNNAELKLKVNRHSFPKDDNPHQKRIIYQVNKLMEDGWGELVFWSHHTGDDNPPCTLIDEELIIDLGYSEDERFIINVFEAERDGLTGLWRFDYNRAYTTFATPISITN